MSQRTSSRRRGVFIAWMPVSQRSTTLADRLGFDLVLIARTGFRNPWTAPLVYPILIVRTIAAIVRRRPRAAIVAAPPFLAPLVALPFLWVLGARWAIDVHSGAVLDRRWRWSMPILTRIARRSAGAIVTLPSLESPFRDGGAPTLVLPDPLPDLASMVAAPDGTGPAATDVRPSTDGGRSVVAVCGWGDDEPLDALVDAAIGRRWRLMLTGRPRRELDHPDNVTIAGFLTAEDYARTLARADAIVVLTERDDTLLSGAWEAISLGRPLVVSRTHALQTTFGSGVRYVDPDATSIAEGIDAILDDPTAADDVVALRARFQADGEHGIRELADRLHTSLD
jgi:Glycosyl transferases group 1